jgi:hypothetical protein
VECAAISAASFPVRPVRSRYSRTYATVIGINPAANILAVEKPSGELATYDPRRLTGVSVYREIDREFSVGDRIQFTAPDKSLGVANRDLTVIESIAPDGRISARLDNNRQVEFNPREHRHFDHGYAVTSHSSQGLTAERVLVNADIPSLFCFYDGMGRCSADPNGECYGVSHYQPIMRSDNPDLDERFGLATS